MPLSTPASDYSTVTSTSQRMVAMTPGVQYILRSDIAIWYSIGTQTAAVASAADGSHYLPAGTTALVGAEGPLDTVAVQRVGSADGVCTLSKLVEVP
jgi:hypothetical protein